jgi:hypothetical protein
MEIVGSTGFELKVRNPNRAFFGLQILVITRQFAGLKNMFLKEVVAKW